MVSQRSLQSTTFSLSFLAASIQAAVIVLRDANENVALTNCKNGNGARSSQIAYFSGAVSGVPDAIVTVQSGSTVVWEGNTVTGTFSNGNQFTSQIVSPKVAAGAYAGPGHNNYGDFSCWLNYVPSAYTDSNGNTCDMIYDCNHNNAPQGNAPPGSPPPGSPPQGTARFDFQVGGGFATTQGHYSAQDILSTVDQAIGDPYCNTNSIPIADTLCTISYTCHGDVPGQTVKGMAEVLKTVVSQTPGLVTYYSETAMVCDPDASEPPPKGQTCHKIEQKTDYTKIGASLNMNVVYVPKGNPDGASDQGQLSYAISCPTFADDCNLCKGFTLGLQGIGLLVSADATLTTIFGLGSFVEAAECTLSGC